MASAWVPVAILALPLAASAQALGPEVAATVAQVVPEGTAREMTLCKLQSALWGGYDVRVHITMATDGLPYLFALEDGGFRRVVDLEPRPGPNRFERTGRVGARSAEDAFRRGLPFFLAADAPAGAGQVAFAVHANPAMPMGAATLLVTIDQPGAADLAFLTLAVEPGLAVQRLVATHEALRGPVLVRAAVLREVGGRALLLGCVGGSEMAVERPSGEL